MSQHEWSTYQCTDYKWHDECLLCGAKRFCGDSSGWKWHYVLLGETCTGALASDMSAAVVRGRE